MVSQEKPNAASAQLRQITATLLDENSSPFALHRACQELHPLCVELSGLEETMDSTRRAADSPLENGYALSPNEAGRCIWDFARTTMFVRGVKAAIEDLLLRFPGNRLEVLYAGCGPFAPLIIPLLEFYAPGQLNVTLLDYHQRSLDSVRALLHKFELDQYAVHLVRADALHYIHPVRPHLVICEVMQTALEREPQVAVTFNLAPQVREGGIFIPELITAEVVLADSAREMALDQGPRHRIDLGSILEINSAQLKKDTLLSPVIVEIPATISPAMNFRILTKVRVFGRHKLDDYDAAITYPRILRELGNLAPGTRIEFSYVLGPEPRFEYKLL